jgi:hypothetical protein
MMWKTLGFSCTRCLSWFGAHPLLYRDLNDLLSKNRHLEAQIKDGFASQRTGVSCAAR